MTEKFSTTEIDLAAAVVLVAEEDPDVAPDKIDPRVARFTFPDDRQVQDAVMRFTADELMVPARQYAGIRHRLFKLARSMRWGGER